MAKTKKIGKVKVKKKRWFPIFAPKFLGQKEIGESYLADIDSAIGRPLKINLRELTGSIKDQNIYVSLKIKEVAGSNLQTEVTGYAYMPFFIKRLTRRNVGKIEDSFILKTKDGKKVRLKPLVVTVFKVTKPIKTVIRKKVIELLSKEVSKTNFDSLINDLLRYRVQNELKRQLKKIYPTREMIMRVAKLEKGKVKAMKAIEVVEEETSEPEKSEAPETKTSNEKTEQEKKEK